MMKKRVLITGATGFVGSYLAELLLEKNCEVWGTGLPGEKYGLPADTIVRPLDLNRKEDLSSLIKECKPEFIYHLAAQSSVGRSWQDPLQTMQINLEGCINLLEVLHRLKIDCKVLLTGSGEEYGPVQQIDLPIKETRTPDPRNPYSLSKLFQTLTGLYYFNSFGMKIYLARAFNHTGPRQNKGFVVPDFASQIAAIEAGRQEAIIKVGNLSAQRDFSDVRDVVAAYWQILETGQPGIIYNIGSGKPTSIQEILDILISLSEIPVQVEIDPEKFRPIDVPVIYSDISNIKSAIGWQPRINLEETIKDTLNYWRKQIYKETSH